jgi:ectoine hydroxylase-related dioxygenase (phytanoyl-CoA dioxygenase family)
VIEGSHLKGICRSETINRAKEKEVVCRLHKGSVMIMRPLLQHASNRTINNRRRVVHIEFSNSSLPKPLNWLEKIAIY